MIDGMTGFFRAKASARPRMVQLVTINGMKIPSEYHQKVFDKFFQVERSKYEQQGTGMGLTIAKFLVELNGGQIQILSTDNNETCFELLFPQTTTIGENGLNSSTDNTLLY